MVRWLEPKGGGAETPGKVANNGRTLKSAASIHQRIARLDIGAVLDRCDIAYEDRLRSMRADGNVVQALESPTTELTGTIGIRSPMRTLPDGLTVLPAPNACTTSSGDML